VRLATFARENGAQPIVTQEGSIAVTCSGELYDYAGTRRELEAKGHRFRTGSDCELILHLYREHGALGCVQRLRGEFAFVLWDDSLKRMMAARDGLGVRPLFFAELPSESGKQLIFASEAKGLFAMGVEPRWSRGALSVAASLQYPLAAESLFDGVHPVRPGEVILQSYGEAMIHHRLGTSSAPWSGSFADAVEAVRAEVEDAVHQRMRAEVPVAALLSGGLDSTVVAALAARTSPGIAAYTVSFGDDAAYDERALAASSAEALGLDHRVVGLRAETLRAALPKAVAHSEGLSINHHVAAKYLLMRRLREDGFAVALTGEGADELFFGYAHLRSDAGVGGVASSNAASAGLMLPTGASLAQDLDPVRAALGFLPTWVQAKAELGTRFRSLLQPEFRAELDAHQPVERFASSVAHLRGESDNPSLSARTWSDHALSGYILGTLSDRMELAHAVEGRPAFLDQRVVALARSLPTEFKIRGRVEKAVLREAAKGWIPEDVRTREKHPFLAPPMGLDASATKAETDREAFSQGSMLSSQALRERTSSLENATLAERAAWEPAIMLALSLAWLHDAYVARQTAGVRS
jgi:asparagine synthase (glutamine-hydrolysing)